MNFIARRRKAKIPTASLQFADAENRVKQILDILAMYISRKTHQIHICDLDPRAPRVNIISNSSTDLPLISADLSLCSTHRGTEAPVAVSQSVGLSLEHCTKLPRCDYTGHCLPPLHQPALLTPDGGQALIIGTSSCSS